MIDGAKVVKALEICTMTTRSNQCLKCPYTKEERDTTKWCTHGLHRDILALLKEQDEMIRNLKERIRLLEYVYQDDLQGGLMPAT